MVTDSYQFKSTSFADSYSNPCTRADKQPCESCREETSILKQISDAEKSLAALKARHIQVRSKINTYHDSITSRLPPEIVSKIFVGILEASIWSDNTWSMLNALMEYDVGFDDYQWIPPRTPEHLKGVVSAPLQLGSICRSWRRIAWSTPELWRSISVNVGAPILHSRHAELLQACLGRSGDLPLRINLCASAHAGVSLDATFSKAMIYTLVAHSSRWFDLVVALPQDLLRFLRWDDGARPKLERLDLQLTSDDGALTTNKINISSQWTHLTQINLKGICAEHIQQIEWDTITHADVQDFSAIEMLNLISRAPFLTDLTSKLRPIEPPSLSLSVVEHDRLEYLRLSADHDSDAALLLSNAAFPTLSELQVTLRVGGQQDLNLQQVIAVPSLTNSLFNLTGLSLSGCHWDDVSDYISVLEAIPSLEYLEISFAYPMADISPLFQRMGISSGQVDHAMFLPNLKELSVSNVFLFPLDAIFKIFEVSGVQGRSSIDKFLTNTNTSQQRSLQLLSVFLEETDTELEEIERVMLPQVLDRDIFLRFFSLMDKGIIIHIYTPQFIDLYQASYDMYM